MPDLEPRVEHLEERTNEDRGRLDEAEGRLDIHSEAIQSLDQWRKGNGAHGAETRLQNVEEMSFALARERIVPRLAVVEADMRAVQAVADNAIRAGVQEAIHDTLNAREKTTLARLRAWGPVIAAGIAALAVIVQAFVRRG
jgi:hypothetical protein